jgi:benzil reductase ((S)-benzoin forming)
MNTAIAHQAHPVTIITGASRGLGLAMAQQLAAEGHRVLSIARGHSDKLPPSVTQWTDHNLADPRVTVLELLAWIAALDMRQVSAINLINNAGVVSTPGPLAQGDFAELANAIRVGLEAPLLLTAAFLRATADWTVPRKVMLVSSGLGRRGMAGSASYCAAKAGMDNLARALALEEAALPNGARVVSLAPGVIDTDMQAQLRNADPLRFPERKMFAGLHSGGQLDSPAKAAAKVLAYLARDDYGSEAVASVNAS